MRTKVKREIRLTMTEQEAEVLCALLGGTAKYKRKDESRAERVLQSCFLCLNEVLPDRITSFSDFFEGELRCKDG